MVGAASRPVHVLLLSLYCSVAAVAAAEPPADAAKRAPILRAALPRSAEPGQRVTVRGQNLDGVAELRVGDSAVPTAEITKTSVSFVVPDGLKSGPLSVRGPGGEASLKQPYEIYYKPVVTKVTPTRFGPGATLQVEGSNLSEQMQVKLGATAIKSVKRTDQGLELQLPATMARGGVLQLRPRGRPELRFEGLVFVGAPKLQSAKPLVARPGDTVQVRGRNLDAIDELRVGEQRVEPSARSASALSFVIAGELAGGVIEVRGAGGSASLPKPLVVMAASAAGKAGKPGKSDPGVVLALRYAASGNGVSGEIRGQGFDKDTRFAIDGETIESTAVVDGEHATFTLPGVPEGGERELVAVRGGNKSSAYRFDAAAGGYRFRGDQLAGLLSGAAPGYELAQVRLDLDQSAIVFASPAGEGAARVATVAGKAKSRRLVNASALALAVELERLTVAQRARCAAMAAGKDRAKHNAYAGELLARATQQARKLIDDGLARLWSGLPAEAWTPGTVAAELGFAAIDDKLGAVLAARAALVERECAERYHGAGKLLARASETADAGIEREYHALVERALTQLSASAGSPEEGAQRVQQALAVFSDARRELWSRQLSALTARVQDRGKVTGKGARTGKKAEKVGKR